MASSVFWEIKKKPACLICFSKKWPEKHLFIFFLPYMNLVMKKNNRFLHMGKAAGQLCSCRICIADQRLVQFLYFLSPKVKASSHVMWAWFETLSSIMTHIVIHKAFRKQMFQKYPKIFVDFLLLNNFSVISGLTSTSTGIKCLAQGYNTMPRARSGLNPGSCDQELDVLPTEFSLFNFKSL